MPAILHALDGRFVRPAPGGDLLRTPGDPADRPQPARLRSLPHPERLRDRRTARGRPSGCSRGTQSDGNAAARVDRAGAVGHRQPEDRRRPDRPGAGADGREAALRQLRPARRRRPDSARELGRPRIDVVITLSGIFRDLLPLQTACSPRRLPGGLRRRAVEAMNFVRKHALAYQREHGGDLETAALRVFCNADGAYGSNVNQLIDNGSWDDEDELAETYTRRKGFAYGRDGKPVQQAELLKHVLCRRRARLPEPRLGRTRRHHDRPLLRHARRHQPRGAPRQGRRTCRSISATRPAATARCARWPSRSRSRPARACSTRSGTRAC